METYPFPDDLYAGVIGPLRAMIGHDGEVYAGCAANEALARTYAATARGAGLCVGRAFAGVGVAIIAITDGPIATLADARVLASGDIGEIIVRGPHVSPEYAGDPESTRASKIADGDGVWHRPGDAGYLDATGRLWCCGRVGHRVPVSSGTLFPLQCEPIFDADPRVRRSGLVGVHLAQRTVPVICVELADPVPRGDELAALRDQLLALALARPTTRAIRHVLFHPGLPVDPRHSSKIERPALARWAAAQLACEPGRVTPPPARLPVTKTSSS